MKKMYLMALVAVTLSIFASCRKELPYPIDEVKRGVLIDVSRVAGTPDSIAVGQTTGSCHVKLTIPELQGDHSSLSHAQLLAVLTGAPVDAACVVVDNIVNFPADVPVSVADLYGKLGLSVPAQGEVVHFTANVVLKSGEIIPGWSQLTGFNSWAFVGWQVDGREYSYRATYPVK
ncbi:MAG: hypothetical protein LBT94_03610 [Prevotellaceae bacterium]|jgi:hypothetical protein|nr:hypothetical protein [Prevotellaceae bacterium]